MTLNQRFRPLKSQLRRLVYRTLMAFEARSMSHVKARLLACSARQKGGAGQGVVHCAMTLGAGGAERQLSFLVSGAHRRGLSQSVLSMKLKGPDGHFLPDIRQAGVSVEQCPTYPQSLKDLPGELRELVSELPFYLRRGVASFLPLFLKRRPAVVHCWLDQVNIWAGLAALLAGVPRIVLSTRSMRPSNFLWYDPWYDPWYQFLASLPEIRILNNSRAGARDYEAWLGLPLDSIKVVLNGLDAQSMKSPASSAVQRFREGLGLVGEAPLLMGLFRLSEEKRPEMFLKIAGDVLDADPHAHVAIVGEGPMEASLRALVKGSRHRDRVHLLGRRDDIPVLLTAADVMLLTSIIEGTPNVLLEAQWLGCPPVSTRAGGAVDTILDGETGYLCGLNDVDALRQRVLSLMGSPQKRAAFSASGRAFMTESFGLERMVDETIALY